MRNFIVCAAIQFYRITFYIDTKFKFSAFSPPEIIKLNRERKNYNC